MLRLLAMRLIPQFAFPRCVMRFVYVLETVLRFIGTLLILPVLSNRCQELITIARLKRCASFADEIHDRIEIRMLVRFVV